jgi:hypothetical protein
MKMSLKEILENYVQKVSPRVDMKREKDIAHKYLDSLNRKIKRAN